MFANKDPKLEGTAVGADVNITPPDEPGTFLKPSITKSEPKTGRTPIHILRYLSDMDTPSPNSRQITPMPKTTIYVSPSKNSKTPALGDSLGMMSPEHVVRRFPANNDGSPLVTLAAGAGKEGSRAVTPCGQLAVFSLDSPGKSEKRRDSVFFASVSTSVAGAVDNLMSFSPVVESNESGTCCLISISSCLSAFLWEIKDRNIYFGPTDFLFSVPHCDLTGSSKANRSNLCIKFAKFFHWSGWSYR